MKTPPSAVAFCSACRLRRWSPGAKRKLKLTAFGVLGLLLVGTLAFFAYLLHSIPAATPFLKETGLWPWIVAVVLSIAVTAGLVWLEIRQTWRQP